MGLQFYLSFNKDDKTEILHRDSESNIIINI